MSCAKIIPPLRKKNMLRKYKRIMKPFKKNALVQTSLNIEKIWRFPIFEAFFAKMVSS